MPLPWSCVGPRLFFSSTIVLNRHTGIPDGMYNLRTLENPMLLTNFLRWLERLNPGADILSLIDPTLEPQEALREIKRRYPHIIIEKPPEDDFLSVNCFIKPVDMRYSVSECLYCHKPCKAERSTKRYCSNSHRVMACRRRKKDCRRQKQALYCLP